MSRTVLLVAVVALGVWFVAAQAEAGPPVKAAVTFAVGAPAPAPVVPVGDGYHHQGHWEHHNPHHPHGWSAGGARVYYPPYPTGYYYTPRVVVVPTDPCPHYVAPRYVAPSYYAQPRLSVRVGF